jgi:hypothetical protein
VRLAPTREIRNQTRNAPRHRLEQPRNHRHLLVVSGIGAACTVAAISVGLAAGGGAVSATAPTPSPAAQVIPARAPQPEPVVRGSIIAADGTSPGDSAGSVTGGTTVTVTGAALGTVASASFGGHPGAVVATTNDTVTITTPPAADLTEGTVAVELFDIAGKAVKVTEPTVDAASVAAPLKQLTFKYMPDPHVMAQTAYALAHWNNYNIDEYGVLPGNDCVNFTSQSLFARGWAMDADWWFDTNSRGSSAAWNSSTALAGYLSAHPERATAVADDQRRQLKIGDVVQFDWDSSGDQDHTGIVTRVDKTDDGVKVYYAGHTSDTDYKSVDESLANGGGSVSYWSVV